MTIMHIITMIIHIITITNNDNANNVFMLVLIIMYIITMMHVIMTINAYTPT